MSTSSSQAEGRMREQVTVNTQTCSSYFCLVENKNLFQPEWTKALYIKKKITRNCLLTSLSMYLKSGELQTSETWSWSCWSYPSSSCSSAAQSSLPLNPGILQEMRGLLRVFQPCTCHSAILSLNAADQEQKTKWLLRTWWITPQNCLWFLQVHGAHPSN